MKKSLTNMALKLTALSFAMATASVQADEYFDIYDYDSNHPEISTTEATGLGIGALIGALLAGPPGALVGGAGGGLFAENSEQELKLSSLQSELDTSQNKLATLEQQNIQLSQQVQQAEIQRVQLTNIKSVQPALRLGDALANGFSFAVQFRTNSANLEKHFSQQLTDLAHAFVAIEDLHVRISGHADRRGTQHENEVLSQKRAEKVVSVLRNAGWPVERLHMTALGETRPLTNEKDRVGYDFDRRVIVSFGAEGAGI